jgi:type IV pilus assembly protein PilE
METVTMPLPCRPAERGFTLLEVMITVAIVGILAAIAVPSYSDYITRSRITEATNALADYRNRMEKYFLDHRSYVDGGAACAVSGDMTSNYNGKGGHLFEMSCAADATTYTLTATGKAQMNGFVYTVNQADARKSSSLPTGWSTPSPNNCWALRKDGSCS